MQCQRMRAAYRNGDIICTCRNLADNTACVFSPSCDGTVKPAECKVIVSASGDRELLAVRHIKLTVGIVSPRSDRSVCSKRYVVR